MRQPNLTYHLETHVCLAFDAAELYSTCVPLQGRRRSTARALLLSTIVPVHTDNFARVHLSKRVRSEMWHVTLANRSSRSRGLRCPDFGMSAQLDQQHGVSDIKGRVWNTAWRVTSAANDAHSTSGKQKNVSREDLVATKSAGNRSLSPTQRLPRVQARANG